MLMAQEFYWQTHVSNNSRLHTTYDRNILTWQCMCVKWQ